MPRAVPRDSFTLLVAPSAPDFQFQSTSTDSTKRNLPVRTFVQMMFSRSLERETVKKGVAEMEFFVGVLHRREPQRLALLVHPCHGFTLRRPATKNGSKWI